MKRLFAIALVILFATQADAVSLRMRARGSSPGVVLFGAKNLNGLGGFPTLEAANSGISGTNAGNFAVDDLSRLVPAGGSFASIWTHAANSYGLTGASGRAYGVTVIPNAAWATSRNGTATNPDTPGGNEISQTMYRATASGGLALGDTLYLRAGTDWDPTDVQWFINFQVAANYTGTGRITLRCDTPDFSGAMRHACKMGLAYLSPDIDNETQAFDVRDIWFYMNDPTLSTLKFAVQAQRIGGIGVYNSRFENGPGAPDATAEKRDGVSLSSGGLGGYTVSGNKFIRLGDGIGIGNAGALGTGAVVVSYNEFSGIFSDAIDALGSNITIFHNFDHDKYSPPGFLEHPDLVQQTGNNTNYDGMDMEQNIGVRNQAPDTFIDSQGFFISGGDGTGFTTTNVKLKNNITNYSVANQIALSATTNPLVQFNTTIMDLCSTYPSASGSVVILGFGGTGGTVDHNISNVFNLGGQPGVVASKNLVLPAVWANYTTMFPSMPTNCAANRFPSYAAVLVAFTPANLPVASGGAVEADGTVDGALFPACAGQINGAWNDGTVWACGNGAWLAAHPPAT